MGAITALEAILFSAKMGGIIMGVAFLSYALNRAVATDWIYTVLPAWPAEMAHYATYFGVGLAMQVMISFITIRITIAAAFAIARFF